MAEVIYEVREDTEEEQISHASAYARPLSSHSICSIPNCCTVKFIQQKKKSIWAIPFFSFCFIVGLIVFVIACLEFKDFLLLVSLVPLPFIFGIVLIFGCPTPFDDDFDNTPIDCSCIEEDCQMYLSKNVGHFMLSCIGIGPFGITVTLFVTGEISLLGMICGLIGVFVLILTSILYLIRYHYKRRNWNDDDDYCSDDDEDDEMEMNNL